MTWAMILLIPATSLAFSASLFSNIFVSPKLITLALGLAILAWSNHRRNRLSTAMMVFVVVACMSAIFAVDHWLALVGHYRSPYYGLLAIAMVTVAYSCSAGLDARAWLMLAGAVQGAISIAQQCGFFTQHIQSGRSIGTIGGPVFLGAFLVIAFMAAYDRARLGKSKLDLLYAGMIAAGIMCARAKGAALACMAGILAYEGLWATGILSMLALLWSYMVLMPSQTNLERLELMRISAISFINYPWFGWGPDNFILAFCRNRTPEYVAILGNTLLGQASAHNDIFQVAATLGIVGLAAYLYLLFDLARSTKSRYALATLAAMWIQAQVNPVPIESMVMLAMVLGGERKS